MILTKSDQVRSKTPKKYKKPKKARVKTPRPEGPYMCEGCGKTRDLSIHHVYYGHGNRDLSSKHGAVCWLCWKCHQSSTGIHGTHSNGELDKELKRVHQIRLMEEGISMDDFIDTFGRSYVGVD